MVLIRIEHWRKGRKRPNIYLDDKGHADWQQHWEWIEEGNYGQLLSRHTHLHPMCDTLDPEFNVSYDET